MAGEGGGPDGRFALHQDAESQRTSAHGDGIARVRRRRDGGRDAKLTAVETVMLGAFSAAIIAAAVAAKVI